MAPQGEPVLRIHVDVTSLQTSNQSRVEVDEADHIEPVVLERRFQEIEGAGAQEIKVRVGDQGNITVGQPAAYTIEVTHPE